jgi:hypothetical protein
MVIESGNAQRPAVCCITWLGFFLRLFTKLNNFESDQILPAIDPGIEQRTIARLHQLKASIAILLKPAIDVNQPVRKHPSFLVEALVNLRFRAGREVLDDHIPLHVLQSLTLAVSRADSRSDVGAKAVGVGSTAMLGWA